MGYREEMLALHLRNLGLHKDKYNKKIMKVLEFTQKAFSGSVDIGGTPYIDHLVHVAINSAFIAKTLEYSQDHVFFAFLIGLSHDTIEDCDEKIANQFYEMVGEYGIVIRAVRLVTKDGSKSNGQYIADIAKDGLATICKFCDLRHNMMVHRISYSAKISEKRLVKYLDSYNVLGSGRVQHPKSESILGTEGTEVIVH